MELDKPNGASWRLDTLPPDIFSLVAFYLDVNDLVTAILVGSIPLTRLMFAHGAITSLMHEGETFPFHPKSLHFFLQSLPSLTDLSVKPPNWLFSADYWANLPPTLTRVDTFCYQNFELASENPIDFCLVEALPHLRSFSFTGGLTRKMAATLPPTLEYLKMHFFSSESFLPASLTSLELWSQDEIPIFVSPLPNLRKMVLDLDENMIGDIAEFLVSLPQTLEDLILKNIYDSVDVSMTHLLPHGLRTLHWEATFQFLPTFINCPHSGRSGDLITFPPHLTHLTLVGSPPIELFSPFPRSLKQFKWFSRCSYFPADLYSLLPSTLESLYHHDLSQDWMVKIKLPDSLTSVELPKTKFNFSALSSLPQSIKTLQLGNIVEDLDSDQELLVWPLQTLNFPNLTSFTWDNHRYIVPASLFRCLAIGCPNLTQCFVTQMSTKLSAALSQYQAKRSSIDYEVFLRSFCSFNGISDDKPAIATQQEEMEPETTTIDGISLPITSKTEDSYMGPPFQFSDRLKVFWAPLAAFGDELITTLPVSSLNSLVLPQASFITDDCFIDTIQYCKNLQLLSCPSPSVTGRAFPYLPRKLETLSLSNSSLIFDYEVCDIPPTVTVLHLEAAVHLTDACSPSLPKKLTVLDLSNNQTITETIASVLPSTSTLHAKQFTATIRNGVTSIIKT